MEYFVGFALSILSFAIISRLIKNVAKEKIPSPVFSQSRKVALVKYYVFAPMKPKKEVKKQSTEHLRKNATMAYFWGNNVYWIENGFLVTAKLKDNQIDETTKIRVDTYSLDKVELDKMIFIVDKLTGGKRNDSSDSGK